MRSIQGLPEEAEILNTKELARGDLHLLSSLGHEDE
jgi:hypothetical protein